MLASRRRAFLSRHAKRPSVENKSLVTHRIFPSFALGARGTLVSRYRVEKEKGQEERLLADAAERKRQAKLRRAREREKRKSVDMERARHEQEMEKIER